MRRAAAFARPISAGSSAISGGSRPSARALSGGNNERHLRCVAADTAPRSCSTCLAPCVQPAASRQPSRERRDLEHRGHRPGDRFRPGEASASVADCQRHASHRASPHWAAGERSPARVRKQVESTGAEMRRGCIRRNGWRHGRTRELDGRDSSSRGGQRLDRIGGAEDAPGGRDRQRLDPHSRDRRPTRSRCDVLKPRPPASTRPRQNARRRARRHQGAGTSGSRARVGT